LTKNAKKKLKWGLILFVLTLVLIPVQMLNLISHEQGQSYWCDEAHFSQDRCDAAENAVASGVRGLIVTGLVMLVGSALLLDLLIMPQREDAVAAQT